MRYYCFIMLHEELSKIQTKLTLAEKNVENKILCNGTERLKMERFSKNKNKLTVSEQLE